MHTFTLHKGQLTLDETTIRISGDEPKKKKNWNIFFSVLVGLLIVFYGWAKIGKGIELDNRMDLFIGIIGTIIFSVLWLDRSYKLLYRYSLAEMIPLEQINGYEVTPVLLNKPTEITLIQKDGMRRHLRFAKGELQKLEPLLKKHVEANRVSYIS